MKTALHTAMLVTLAAATFDAQRPTLPELAARTNQRIVHSKHRELIPVDLAELMRRSDLVVRGKITRIESYLSEDQRLICTDYKITPTRVIAGRRATRGKPTPGFNEITFTHYGGTMTLHGVPVEVRDDNLPPFEDGTEAVLFLEESEKGRTPFVIVNAVAAFEVVDNKVRPMVKPPLKLEKYRGMGVSEFVRHVESLPK